MDVREKIFKCRMKKLRRRGVRNTGSCLKLVDEQLIPDTEIDTLAKYFKEVCDLTGEDLKKEHQRYLVKKGG